MSKRGRNENGKPIVVPGKKVSSDVVDSAPPRAEGSINRSNVNKDGPPVVNKNADAPSACYPGYMIQRKDGQLWTGQGWTKGVGFIFFSKQMCVDGMRNIHGPRKNFRVVPIMLELYPAINAQLFTDHVHEQSKKKAESK